jgi:ketosteroid isomerase-like protein
MRYLLTALICAPALALASAGDLQETEKAWGEAMVRGDLAALERIFAPRLIYAHATGIIQSKQGFLESLRSGKRKYESLTFEKITVVEYGKSAVTHSIYRVVGRSEAGPFNDHVMALHCWTREKGAWRLAAHQTTKLP